MQTKYILNVLYNKESRNYESTSINRILEEIPSYFRKERESFSSIRETTLFYYIKHPGCRIDYVVDTSNKIEEIRIYKQQPHINETLYLQ